MRQEEAKKKQRLNCKSTVSRFSLNERGQAMTEYLILVVAVGLVCISFSKLLPEAIRGYVRPIYYSVAKPFP